MTEPSSRRRVWPVVIWLGALIVMLGAVFWALGVITLAAVAGCRIDAAAPCLVAGLNLGETLKASLDAAWMTPVTAGGLWLVALALVATIAAHRAFDSFIVRFLAGGVTVALTLLATIVAPVVLVIAIVHTGCQINEGGVGDCLLYGVAQGMSTHSAAVAPWMLFILGPAALAYAVIYLVILSILSIAQARRR